MNTVLPIALATMLLLGVSPSDATTVSLTSTERQRLIGLVSADQEAGRRFSEIKKDAAAALAEQPMPLNRVVSEGTLASDPAKKKTIESMKDMKKIEALSWTWAVTDDRSYAEKAKQFILRWAQTNESDGNSINESGFEPLIEGYDLLRAQFSQTEQRVVDEWLLNKANLLIKDKRGRTGNWESHRIKIVGLISIVISQRDLLSWAETDFKRHLGADFDAKGESVDYQRRDALHYHLYSVKPLLTFTCAADRMGDHLFDYRAQDGASLRAAVDFLVPFAKGDKQHIEFEHTGSTFDKTRARAGESEFSPHKWNPGTATAAFAEAGCLDSKYDDLARNVDPTRSRYPEWRSVLNAAASVR